MKIFHLTPSTWLLDPQSYGSKLLENNNFKMMTVGFEVLSKIYVYIKTNESFV